MNKSDLKSVISEDELKLAILRGLAESDDQNQIENEILPAMKEKETGFTIIKTSTLSLKETGMKDLENEIYRMFIGGEIHENPELMITNIRHKEGLIQAYESLQQVMQSIHSDMPEDFYSIDLMSAYSSLGRIIGEEAGEDLINEIFSKFCMGK